MTLGEQKKRKYCMREISLHRVKGKKKKKKVEKCISHHEEVAETDFRLRIEKSGASHCFFLPHEFEKFGILY